MQQPNETYTRFPKHYKAESEFKLDYYYIYNDLLNRSTRMGRDEFIEYCAQQIAEIQVMLKLSTKEL